MVLYKFAHVLKARLKWLWNIIEDVNSLLFSFRYGRKLKEHTFVNVPAGYGLMPIRIVPTEDLVAFFEHQPQEAFTFFHPHGFDAKSIKRLQNNRAFLGYVLIDESCSRIAGYCFNRCFVHGQGFRGRMVDIDYRGRGLGTVMNRILNEVGFSIGLRLFETVSKDNVASYRSALSASNVRVVKEMPDNELYLEILPE